MQDKSGLTLIEMLIYIAILSLIAVVFVSFILDIAGSSQKARIKKDAQQEARFAIERIQRSLREANGVNTGNSTFDVHPGVLSLSMDDVARDPTVFDVSGGVLQITEGAGAAQALTSDRYDVSNLVFTDLSISNRTVNIKTELTLEHPNPENIELFDVVISLQASAVVREAID